MPTLSTDARRILESMGDAFYALDGEWRIVYANRRALAFWGKSVQDVIGKVIWECLPRLVGSFNEAMLRRAREEQQPIDFEAPSPVTGGWVQVTIAPSSNDELSVYWRDITGRMQSEQTLRASEEHLRLAQESGGIGTWEHDLTTGHTLWSPQMFRLIGHEPFDARDGDYEALWLLAVHPDDRDAVAASINDSIHHVRPFSLEFRVVHLDGAVHWINARGNVVVDANGKPRRILGVNIDVTERKLNEVALEQRVTARTKALDETVAALRQWRERYAAIFAHAPIYLAFMRVEPDGRIVCEDVNDAYLQDSGFSREQVVGRSLEETFSPEQAAFGMARYHQVIETGEPLEYEFTHVLPAGSVTRRSFLVPLRNASGQIERILLTSVDLTATRRIEAQLRQAQKMEAIGQLTGGIAHDFNNLLTVVMGNLELLQARLEDERSMRHLRAAQRAAQRGGELTQQLLAYARRQPISPRPVDMTEMIAGTSDLLQRSLGGLVRLEPRLDAGLWPAFCDPTQLELMLLNLAINARDAMPAGGVISIVARNVPQGEAIPTELEAGDYVSIEVIDSGTGMSPETRERAFEPFFTTKEPGKGSGLGLAQVWGLAQQFGGTVLLDSTLGQGTTVQVFLRRAAEPTAAKTANRRDNIHAAPPNGDILVVDDDADARDVALAFLEQEGFTARPAASGKEALACLNHSTISLVLVDYAMPGMSGAELAAHMQKQGRAVPVVFVTGDPDALRAANGGTAHVIAKPYTRAGLVDAVRRTFPA